MVPGAHRIQAKFKLGQNNFGLCTNFLHPGPLCNVLLLGRAQVDFPVRILAVDPQARPAPRRPVRRRRLCGFVGDLVTHKIQFEFGKFLMFETNMDCTYCRD